MGIHPVILRLVHDSTAYPFAGWNRYRHFWDYPPYYSGPVDAEHTPIYLASSFLAWAVSTVSTWTILVVEWKSVRD
jgi:hypothetical protein